MKQPALLRFPSSEEEMLLSAGASLSSLEAPRESLSQPPAEP